MVHSAQRHVGPVVRGSANQLPFRDGAFDVVLSLDLLYIRGVDDALALREARRVLRPGGLLLVNVAAFEWLRGAHDVVVHTRHRYRRSELARLLRAEGFSVRRMMYWNALLLPAVFVARRLVRREAVAQSDLVPLPRMVNWLLMKILAVDVRLCAAFRVPFGTSVFSVASKAPEWTRTGMERGVRT